ncbi:MAG: hypothetical protein A7315_13465 [Candidatus Altiarchaeales archaeon WOR_SM1_79]|nr:MAG: hypothetical protein A7315_13465 [Candidatus Altiarchaeales archaeon WOR_SM1_79]
MNDKEIMEVAKELAEKDFIVFAGTGVTGDTGIPRSWKRLLEELLKSASINNINIDKVDPKEFPDIAQKIYDSLKRQNREDGYYGIIKKNLTPTMTPYSTQEYDILLTTNWVVTTNFDTTFESALDRKFETNEENKIPRIDSLPDFKKENLFERESIVYLHGSVDERFIIFKTSDYENYYPSVSEKNGSKKLEEYLKYIYENYRIVFIGFSFDDQYIRASFENIYEELKRDDEIASPKPSHPPILDNICHYAFLPEVSSDNNDYSDEENKKLIKLRMEAEKLDKDLKSMNIKVIRYNNHIEWMNCFAKTRELKNIEKKRYNIKKEVSYKNE